MSCSGSIVFCWRCRTSFSRLLPSSLSFVSVITMSGPTMRGITWLYSFNEASGSWLSIWIGVREIPSSKRENTEVGLFNWETRARISAYQWANVGRIEAAPDDDEGWYWLFSAVYCRYWNSSRSDNVCHSSSSRPWFSTIPCRTNLTRQDYIRQSHDSRAFVHSVASSVSLASTRKFRQFSLSRRKIILSSQWKEFRISPLIWTLAIDPTPTIGQFQEPTAKRVRKNPLLFVFLLLSCAFLSCLRLAMQNCVGNKRVIALVRLFPLDMTSRSRCYFDIKINGNDGETKRLSRANSIRFVFLSVGRIVFELFDDVCPRTCDNFRSLCTGKGAFFANQVTVIDALKERKAGVQARRRSCPTKAVAFIGSSRASWFNRAISRQVRSICHARDLFFTSMKIFRFSFDL